jgi:NLR family CARD domain-containing protein 3
LFRLIAETPNLQTLDLDQTELGDVGESELFSKLAQHSAIIPLRNIYLDSNGIGSKVAAAIAIYLAFQIAP